MSPSLGLTPMCELVEGLENLVGLAAQSSIESTPWGGKLSNHFSKTQGHRIKTMKEAIS